MIVTCEKCQTQYNLDPAKVGGGCKVRCTKCFNVWFYTPEDAAPVPPVKEAEVLPPAEQQAAPAETPAALPVESKKAEAIPTALKPVSSDNAAPVIDNQPGGMGANQFGVFTFLLLTFATLIALFVARGPIVHHVPPMAALYQAIGFNIHVPGEGLKLSEMTATQDSVMLNISAKLSNISGHDIDYPALTITMRGPYGAVLKEWHIPAGNAKLAKDESVPVKQILSDAPAEGKTVDMRVSDH